ncbi:MAG TPA: hypothetical protein DEB40_12035, partial [Elusimicrobia bacterium]|nr:hypothetical protein [Elusimicrobiota bacterium]
YFVSGMALGTKGQWDVLRGRYLQAYFDGKKAVKHLKKCLKIDPGYHDAFLGLGIYDYQAGHLPGALKLSFLLGIRGNVKRGLERIQLAAQKGRYGSRQAAQFLASIYIIDQRDFARALPLVQKLRQDFPDSPYFQFLDLYLRHRLGDWDGSTREAEALFGRLKADPPAMKRKLLSLVCGLTLDKCLDPELMRRTLPWFEHALELAPNDSPDPWLSFLHLARGQIADISGSRETALADYRWALAHPDALGLNALARDCQRKACSQASALDFLRALSRHPASGGDIIDPVTAPIRTRAAPPEDDSSQDR